ncbi:MAG: glycosyltransferase [Vicinamibacterales bacterium]
MRAAVIAIGSRGDIQPMLALATGLRRAGHEVVFASEESYRGAAAAHDLEFYRLSGNSERFFAGPAGIRFRESFDRPRAEFRRFWTSYIAPTVRPHLDEVPGACEGVDVAVCQPWLGVAPGMADTGVPACIASVFPPPTLPTHEFPFSLSEHAAGDQGPEGNWRTWRRAALMLRIGHETIQRWRIERLGLPAQTFRESLESIGRLPHVLGYSPLVVPKPAEWGPQIAVTGYWFADTAAGYTPPDDLARFLDAGEPPVVVGFGSHVGRDPGRLTTTVLDALARAGMRGILITAWGGLAVDELPDHVFVSRGVPYDWLLPRVKALVHHGGSGTTAIALRVGVPQVVTPFGYDQTFWGGRVHRLGVAPPPLQAATMTADELAGAMRRAATPEVARRAQEVGAMIRSERGIEQAVALIERVGRQHGER